MIFRSIRRGVAGGSRLVWLDVVLAGVALLLTSVLLGAFQFFTLRGELVEDLHVQARLLASNASAALYLRDGHSAADIVGTWARSPSVRAATFFDEDGAVVASYTRAGAPLVKLPAGLAPGRHRAFVDHVVLLEAVDHRGDVAGYLAFEATLDALYRRLLGFVGATMFAGGSALALALLLSKRLRRAVLQAEQRLARMARVDPVTGLANRNSYAELIETTARRAARDKRQFALLLVDLDNFKAINDTMGHATGDELLRLAGQRLANAVRSTDTVCRIGGDEFAIIADRVDNPADAAMIAEALVRALSSPFRITGRDLWATGSVGYTLYPQDAEDLDTLLSHADLAMYAAKNSGRNGFRPFRPEMNRQALARIDLANDLRRALERGELETHYQPQLDVRTQQVVAVEALARWRHPSRGWISALEFIPVAEQSGLIVALGRAILRRACTEAAAWNRGRAHAVAVAVNVSAHDLAEASFPDTVAAALAESGLPAALLEVELTESVLVDSLKTTEQTLGRLRALGVRAAIDDFGTGYCSMAYLKRLPVNRLKIDRAFIGDLSADASDAKLTGAMIAMGHALGLDVVAEGVEQEGQYRVLAAQGCDIVQGHLIGRPMSREALVAWLDEPERRAAPPWPAPLAA